MPSVFAPDLSLLSPPFLLFPSQHQFAAFAAFAAFAPTYHLFVPSVSSLRSPSILCCIRRPFFAAIAAIATFVAFAISAAFAAYAVFALTRHNFVRVSILRSKLC